MSAKINFFNELMASATATAVEPKEGYVSVVTKILFRNESASAGYVTAKSAPLTGENSLVSKALPAKRETGWEGTLVLQLGETLIVGATPLNSIRCIVEGYFLLDVPAHARKGAGAIDEDYARMGCLAVLDSKLVQLTYLTLVELKRIRIILANGPDADPGKDDASAEIENEL